MIDVESEPGKGTAFHLYLPIEESPIGYEEPVEAPRVDTAEGKGTVLLIEDETFLIDMVQSVLDGVGYAVLLARDGEEGVAMFSRHQKEIVTVLTDFGLPKLRGDEVSHRIKAIDPKAKIILISGYFDPGIKASMARIGVDRFLQKPFSIAELTEILQSVGAKS
jgi:CheY-like chemotaxis protein